VVQSGQSNHLPQAERLFQAAKHLPPFSGEFLNMTQALLLEQLLNRLKSATSAMMEILSTRDADRLGLQI
jgi:hypothetical protein